MTLTRLNEIPGLKVGDRVVCTSANGHGDDLPRPWWTVGKTYTVEQVDEPYQPFVRADDGSLSGAVFGYFATAPRETVEDAERSDPADQAELIASLRQVIAGMEDRGGIDWEQRRWDAMLAVAPMVVVQCASDERDGEEGIEQMFARKALSVADALISAARGETQ